MTLKIENLSKKYGDNQVLKDISLEINKGEVFCIYGILSVGKSVLMRIIAGLEKADNGIISFNDINLNDKSFEERGFDFPDNTDDSFWNTLFKTKKQDEIGDGEGQVLAIENALENAENVLLLDNSLSLMDSKTRRKYHQLIRKTAKEKNLAVIFATYDTVEVFEVADKVAILGKGQIMQIGTPQEIYENPNSTMVAEVFGDNNLITVRRLTSKKSNHPEFITINGEHRISTAKVWKENLVPINQNLTLAIRPEHISISFGASFPEDNLLKATVSDIKFQGSTTLLKLDANGLELKVLVLRLVGLNVGDECVVGLPPDRIQVLKD